MTQDIKLSIVTNERWPLVKLSYPNWDLDKEHFYKIIELSEKVRDFDEIPKGRYDTDYDFPDAPEEERTLGLPPWGWHWYNKMQPIMDAVIPELLKIYRCGPNTKVETFEDWCIWCQQYSTNSNHTGHSHGSGCICACQYIKFDPNEHTATEFFHIPPNPFSGDAESFIPEVEEGDVIFFPSPYLHTSGTNTSEKPRAIVAWNMKLEGYRDAHYETKS